MFKEDLVNVSEHNRRNRKVMEYERKRWNMAEMLM